MAVEPSTDATSFGMPVVGPTHSTQHCEQIWQQYCTAWTAIPAQQRQHLIQQATAPHITYTDKLAHITGHAALTKHMEMFQSQAAGASFTTNKLTLHHQCGQAQYTMLDGSGRAVFDGVDFIEFAEDGRLCKVVGFF